MHSAMTRNGRLSFQLPDETETVFSIPVFFNRTPIAKNRDTAENKCKISRILGVLYAKPNRPEYSVNKAGNRLVCSPGAQTDMATSS